MADAKGVRLAASMLRRGVDRDSILSELRMRGLENDKACECLGMAEVACGFTAVTHKERVETTKAANQMACCGCVGVLVALPLIFWVHRTTGLVLFGVGTFFLVTGHSIAKK